MSDHPPCPKPDDEESRRPMDNEDDQSDEQISCPLFMDGLPADFGSNRHLAAIASLLDEVEDEGDRDKETTKKTDDNKKSMGSPVNHGKPKAGGGKVHNDRRGQRRNTIASPYQAPKKSSKAKPSIGEAQLFLKMWKL